MGHLISNNMTGDRRKEIGEGNRSHLLVRNDGNGSQHRRVYRSNSSTTFFFSNFPDDYGEKDMLKTFQRWARVTDVFISRRLNKWGRRFGFVSLFDVKNVAKMEKELDQIYIVNMKLYVNIPKYRRHQVEVPRVESKDDRKMIMVRPTMGKNKMEDVDENKTTKRKEGWEERRGLKPFVDVVRGHTSLEWKGPVFKTHKQVLPWMEKSLVGKYNEDMDFEQLGEEFVRGGMNIVRVRSLGDNLALLIPREGENMEELVHLNREWFDSVFISIMPWSAAQIVNHRVVWVRCFGLPISLWNRECFAKVIGESASSLIAIDDTTLLWENLEFARLKVCVENSRFVKVAKKMRINNQILSISIEEECPKASVGKCNGYHCNFESSDNITSIESYVEESALSVKSGEEECNREPGVERRPTGEAIGGGEEDGRDDQKSKAFFEVHSARSRECQKGGEFSFTKGVIQNQNPLLEPAFDNIYDQLCGYPFLETANLMSWQE